jgi:nucleoside-diphosphate-sugar epimerase
VGITLKWTGTILKRDRSMDKILIVGGCGYIGGHLTDIMLTDHDITVYDTLMYESRFFKDVHFIRGDVRDYKNLGSIIHDYNTVIWLAAIVGDGACAVNAKLTKEINEDSVQWLSENYKGKIVFMSTCSVYGVNDELLNEDAPLNPLSDYARSKVKAEKYIIDNSDNFLIFRLGTLFGMGDHYSRPRLDLVVNILTKRAIEGEVLNVYGGEQWRPLLHVKDVGEGIKYVVDHDVSGLYNIAMGNYRISDLARKIAEVIPSTEINYEDIPFEDFRNYRVSTDPILQNTSWRPKYTLEFGIQEIAEIIKEKRLVEPEDDVYSNAKYIRHRYV